MAGKHGFTNHLEDGNVPLSLSSNLKTHRNAHKHPSHVRQESADAGNITIVPNAVSKPGLNCTDVRTAIAPIAITLADRDTVRHLSRC